MGSQDAQDSCAAGRRCARVPPADRALATGLLEELQRRLTLRDFQISGRRIREAARPFGYCEQTDTSMHMHTTRNNPYLDVRPAQGLRHIDHPSTPATRPVSGRTPVLPRGWAPLTGDQQRAVLDACDASPDAMVFRLGSACDPETEYRVYRLENESWGGLWLASECLTDCDGTIANRVLLGLGSDASVVIRIALDVVNRDLAVRGEPCRLGVDAPAVPPADPRRI